MYSHQIHHKLICHQTCHKVVKINYDNNNIIPAPDYTQCTSVLDRLTGDILGIMKKERYVQLQYVHSTLQV